MSNRSNYLEKVKEPRASAPTFFENLITIDELVDLFKGRIPKATIYVWIHRYGMPRRKIGRHLFFDRVAVASWVEGKFHS